MKSLIYRFLVWFANLFAVVFRQEVTIFDRLASKFEPKSPKYFNRRFKGTRYTVEGHHSTRLHSLNAHKCNVR